MDRPSGPIALTRCSLDLERGVVLPHDGEGERARLTTRERDLLRYLAERSPEPVPREELMASVWGYADHVLSRACDVAVSRVRAKIEVDPAAPDHLLTAHGSGYQLVFSARPAIPAPARPVTAPLALGDARIDLDGLRIDGPSGHAHLTANEAAVLRALWQARGAVVDRGRLVRQVWGALASYGRRLDSTIFRLRAKLEPDPSAPRYLRTAVRGGYQLLLDPTAPATPADLPPLPVLLDREFGLGAAVDGVLADLGRDRIVTLVGPGGVGKTRLAMAVAHRRRGAGDVVGWVDAAHAVAVEALWTSLGTVVGVELESAPVEQLAASLRARGPALLVLDNLEQLSGAGSAVAELLSRAPELGVLATSRVPLRTRGERVVPVQPLPLADAVALFVDRAVRPPDPSELAAVEALVRELDGLPLSIELAAARTAVLSADALRARAAEQLGLLVSRDGARSERQRSQRASLDTTFDLLGAAARRALTQLAVFEAPATMDALEAVLALDPADPPAVDVLEQLVDWSLVRMVDGRASLPVLIRQYAAERLGAAERAAAEERHGAWFARPLDEVEGPREREILARLAQELPDVAAALERAIARGDGVVAVGALIAACALWSGVGPLSRGVDAAERVLTCPLDPRSRAVALRVAAQFHARTGDAERALAHLDAIGSPPDDPEERFEGAAVRFVAQFQRGDIAAFSRSADEALAAALRSARASARYRASLYLARAALERRELAAARGALAQADALAAEVGPTLRARAERRWAMYRLLSGERAVTALTDDPDQLHNRAMERAMDGRAAEALALALASLEGHERTGNRAGRAMALARAGWAHLELGQLDLADRALAEAAGSTAGSHRALALHGLALLCAEREDFDGAAALLREAIPLEAPRVHARALLGWVLCRGGSVAEGVPDLEAAAADRSARGLALVLLGDARADAGQLAEARRLFEEALAAPAGKTPRAALDHAATSLAGVLARLGDADGAARALATLDERPQSAMPSRRVARELAAAELALCRGDGAGARAALARAATLTKLPRGRHAELLAIVERL